MNYEEIVKNIKPYVENVKQNNENSKEIEAELEKVEKDISDFDDLGEAGKSEKSNAENKKQNLEAKKTKLKNKSINELSSAKKVIKEAKKDYAQKAENCTKELGLRETTIKRCKDQMLELKKNNKNEKYKATNNYVKTVIEEKKNIAKQRTEIINNFREAKPRIDNLESLLTLSKIEELDKEIEDASISTPDPVTPDQIIPDSVTPDPVTPDPVTPDPVTPDQIIPDSVTLDPVTPDPIIPNSVTPDPVIPDPVTPDSITPDLIDMDLFDKVLKKVNENRGLPGRMPPPEITSERYKDTIENLAKYHKLTPQQILETEAQKYNVIPKVINKIEISSGKYVMSYGNLKEKDTLSIYTLCYSNDEPIEEQDRDLNMQFDRKSEEEYRKILKAKYPEAKECIGKLDLGTIKVLDENNPDQCKIYIKSVLEGKIIEGLPDIEYFATEQDSLTNRESYVTRRNARNNSEIADNNIYRNFATKAYDFLVDKKDKVANWFENSVKTKFLPKSKEEPDERSDASEEGLGEDKSKEKESFRKGMEVPEARKACDEVSYEHANGIKEQTNPEYTHGDGDVTK